jgi:hypothetical protein
MSLKEKLRVVLNQKGSFKCPNGRASRHVPSDENLSKVIADLRKRGAARPRTMKTLGSTIAALFQKTLTNSEVAALIAKLQAQGVISADGTKVSYEF